MSLALLSALTLGLAGCGIAEARQHARRLARVPTRIHVNGTRGKSSVTRLIAAGLRQHGQRVLAKATGTLPRLILPQGEEQPIERRGRPNIIEQLRMVRVAAALHVDALVIECMAVRPELQWIAETKLIRATHGVITNVRPDHLDVMGPTEADVARALAGTVPYHGTLFTTEETHLEPIRRACADRETALHVIAPLAAAELMAGFAHREHSANVALALAMCEHLGVARDTAIQGMWTAQPDPGALTEHPVQYFGKRLVFINAFAANDPVSSGRIWHDMLARHHDAASRIAIFNCRRDRVRRSEQLGVAYAQWPQASAVVLVGSGTHAFATAAVRAGVSSEQLIHAEGLGTHDIVERLLPHCDTPALIVGLGNIADVGLELTRWFANRAADNDKRTWMS